MPGFLDILNELRVEFKMGSGPNEVNICCPFCVDRGETEDTRFRLGINFVDKLASCFNCNWKSRDAVKWVLWKLGSREVADTESKVEEKVQEKPKLPDDFELLHRIRPGDVPAYYGKEYLLRRGFTVEDMKAYGFGVSLVGKYAHRIVMPVRWRGKLKGLVCRDFTKRALAKYLNTKGDKYLWNLPAFIKHGDLLVLSEGIFKAIAIQKSLGVCSSALLGHSITAQQLKQLKFSKAKHILVWPDPDIPGIKGQLAVCQVLKASGYAVSTLWPVPKKQADEYTSKRLATLFKKRRRAFDWALQTKIEAFLSFGEQDD